MFRFFESVKLINAMLDFEEATPIRMQNIL